MTSLSSSSLEASLQTSARTGGPGLVCLCGSLAPPGPPVAAGAACEVPSKETEQERAWCRGELPFLSEAPAGWVPSPPPHLGSKLGLLDEVPFWAGVVTTMGATGAVEADTGGLAAKVRT